MNVVFSILFLGHYNNHCYYVNININVAKIIFRELFFDTREFFLLKSLHIQTWYNMVL